MSADQDQAPSATDPDPAAAAAAAAGEIAKLLAVQDGVISRRQVVECGLTPAHIERMLRRREWVRMLPGIFVDHTGEVTWNQRAWAGVLSYWPAALAGTSALHAAKAGESRPPGGSIQLVVASSRKITDIPGYDVRRVIDLRRRVQWQTSPPRMRVEEAALDSADAKDSDLTAIQVLADVVQSRLTTAQRLVDCLDGRSRQRRRAWLRGVLLDLAQGTCSVLEHGYLDLVERPHGLPSGHRQAHEKLASGAVLRDVDYAPVPLLVELDGRVFHDNARQRDLDLDRDLDAAVTGRRTARIGWGQVFGRPCETAERVARLLTHLGWTGTMTRCPSCPSARSS